LKRFFLLTLLTAFGGLCGGCGGSAPQTATVEVPGYQALREQFRNQDLSPLMGRRVVLDPGHGGHFQGAVGSGGLTEAEVNLGVALYLRGLLEWAGTEVFMTRTADYDYLSPADSTLAADLAFRVSFTDSLQPDVFLSIHHNSVASLDRTVNETQTYYPLGDDGASLDLAQAVHRHLVINLEISPARILPGNFYVLRNATVPAVLGEPAMISHPVMEGRLSMAASQRLEAEAYFLGLLDYFSQGSPRWLGAPVDTLLVAEDQESVEASWVFLTDGDSLTTPAPTGPGPDPGTFTLTLDGNDAPFHVTGQGRIVDWRLAAPELRFPAVLELKGRNLSGRAAPVRRTVLVSGQPRQVDILLLPESSRETDAPAMGLRWQVWGDTPLPPGRLVLTDGREVPVAGGTRGTGLTPMPPSLPEGIVFQPDGPEATALPCDITVRDLPAPWTWRLLESVAGRSPTGWSLRTGNLQGVPTGLADQAVPLVPHLAGNPVFVAVPGMLPLVDPDPASPDTARTVRAGDRRWITEPLAADLLGKVIVLDPAGGNSDPDGTGPLGTRGATLNLEAALLAKRLLEGCGATVHLTREAETAPLPEEKVLLANAVRADLFLTVGRAADPPRWGALYHPGSEAGETWANFFVACFRGLAPADTAAFVSPSYDFLLRHTACPAVELRLPAPHTPAREMYLSSRGSLRSEARAILVSVLSLLRGQEELIPTLDVAGVIDGLPGAPRPVDVEWAELDGNLDWSPRLEPLGETGVPSLNSGSDPGLPDLVSRHTLEIRAGGSWQLWLLEKSGSEPAARLMMHNP